MAEAFLNHYEIRGKDFIYHMTVPKVKLSISEEDYIFEIDVYKEYQNQLGQLVTAW